MATRTRSRPRSARPWRLTTQRLLIVSGKGGVGKSTVAAAIAIAASRRGLRTLVAEVSGRRDVAPLLAAVCEPSAGIAPGAASVDHVSVRQRSALREYLRAEPGGRLAAKIVAHSRMFELFVDAAPGLSELLTIGQIWDLARPRGRDEGDRHHDLVVLDGPASGQLIGLLTAPRTFGSIARVGPVARQAAAIDRMLRDTGAAAVVAVATAEQMVVTETLALREMLDRELGIDTAAVVVNRMFPMRFTAGDAARLAADADDPAIRTARWFDARARVQQAQLRRLRKELPGVPCSTLPFIFAEALDPAAIDRLALAMSRWLP